MQENNNKSNIDLKDSGPMEAKKVNTTNIFDDFNADSGLEKEIENIKTKESKDLFFYISVSSKVLQAIFFLFFLVILFLWIYIIIQKNESLNWQSFLDPVCDVFSAWVPNPETNCSSISYSNLFYKNKLQRLEKQQIKEVLWVLPVVYENLNFVNSKEVSFLLDKTEDRLDAMRVIEKFDNLKNSFTWVEKRKITCESFEINSKDHTLSMNCTAFSKWYESIIGFSWEKNSEAISWTSISVASSFLNFIEKKSKDFTLLEKEKVFSSESELWDSSWYTSKTKFNLKLKINN